MLILYLHSTRIYPYIHFSWNKIYCPVPTIKCTPFKLHILYIETIEEGCKP